MPTNFELKRLKPKLDIIENPENRMHRLTDSYGAHPGRIWTKISQNLINYSIKYSSAARS